MTEPRAGRRPDVVFGVTAMLIYGALKSAWALGSRIGVRDTDEWDRVFGALSDVEHWLALWGTVVLAGCGVALLLLVVAIDGNLSPGRLTPRWTIWALARLIYVALGLFSVLALGATLINDLQVAVGTKTASDLASWVHYVTYASFLIFAVSLFRVSRSTRRQS